MGWGFIMDKKIPSFNAYFLFSNDNKISAIIDSSSFFVCLFIHAASLYAYYCPLGQTHTYELPHPAAKVFDSLLSYNCPVFFQ